MAWFFPFPLTLYLDDPEPGFTCRFFHSQLSFRAWLIKFYFGVQLGHRSQIFNYYNTDRAYWEPRSSTNIFILTKKRLHERQIKIRSGEYQFFNQLDRTVLTLLEVRVIKSCNINVGDGFWGQLMLVTTLRCWLSIWDVGGRFFTL